MVHINVTIFTTFLVYDKVTEIYYVCMYVDYFVS